MSTKRYRTRHGKVTVTRTRKGTVTTDSKGNVLRFKPKA